MANKQRSLKNFFKTAMLIRGFYFHIAVAGAILLVGFLISASNVLAKIADETIKNQVGGLILVYSIVFAVFILATVICMLVVGHRVGGAQVAISAVIRELKAGNYESQRTLRNDDELGIVMMELVDLAQQLKEQNTITI